MVALLAIPVAIFLIAVELETPKANIPQPVGPEVMPIGILILLIINAIALFVRGISGKDKPISPAGDAGADPSLSSWREKY